MTDVLIIFCVLLLLSGYNFGKRQSGKQVWDVTLPPWCMNDPRLFILVHRQALESAYVTQHIAAWIDLVFGFKQTGKAAVDAINVFHPAVSGLLSKNLLNVSFFTKTFLLLTADSPPRHLLIFSFIVLYPDLILISLFRHILVLMLIPSRIQ